MSAFVNNAMTPVQFYEDTIYYVEKDGEQYVPMKPIIENMGLDWKTQYRKLVSDQNRWSVVIMPTVAKDGMNRETLCIPLRKLTGFLATINPDKVRTDLREKLVRYQSECDEVLYKYWTAGAVFRTHVGPSQRPLADIAFIFQCAGITGNQLALAMDRIYREETGISALAVANVQLVAPRQEQLLTPTEIGKQLNPAKNARAVNKLLEALEYQTKVNGLWQPSEKGLDAGAVLLDTGKKHNSGAPVRQLKWGTTIIPALQEALSTNEE